MNGQRIDGPENREGRRGKKITEMVTHTERKREGGRKQGRKTDYIFLCEGGGEGGKGERESVVGKQNLSRPSREEEEGSKRWEE